MPFLTDEAPAATPAPAPPKPPTVTAPAITPAPAPAVSQPEKPAGQKRERNAGNTAPPKKQAKSGSELITEYLAWLITQKPATRPQLRDLITSLKRGKRKGSHALRASAAVEGFLAFLREQKLSIS